MVLLPDKAAVHPHRAASRLLTVDLILSSSYLTEIFRRVTFWFKRHNLWDFIKDSWGGTLVLTVRDTFVVTPSEIWDVLFMKKIFLIVGYTMSLSQHRNLPEALSRWQKKLWYSDSVRRDLLRKQRGTGLTEPMSTWRSRFLEMPLNSHDAFTRGLTPLACWTNVHFHGIFVGTKTGEKMPPSWSLRAQQGPRAEALSLGPMHWSDPDAAGVRRGQQRSVEASRQHWLIGVRMMLGVTFLDSDPCLSPFLSYLCSHSTPSILSAVRLSPDACVLCTLLRRRWARRGADSLTL